MVVCVQGYNMLSSNQCKSKEWYPFPPFFDNQIFLKFGLCSSWLPDIYVTEYHSLLQIILASITISIYIYMLALSVKFEERVAAGNITGYYIPPQIVYQTNCVIDLTTDFAEG